MHNATSAETPVIRIPEAILDSSEQEVTAVFSYRGEDLPVRVRLFSLDCRAFGVGIYPAEDRGIVLRWDRGPDEDPAVIHWRAPHCPDDVCGSPCGHR